MDELLKLLRIEDLKEEKHQYMASVMGMEAFANLVTEFGGCELYIPEVDRLIIPVRDALIKREFNGSNYFQIAQKWRLSERHIRDITKNEAKEIRRRPVNGQIKLY